MVTAPMEPFAKPRMSEKNKKPKINNFYINGLNLGVNFIAQNNHDLPSNTYFLEIKKLEIGSKIIASVNFRRVKSTDFSRGLHWIKQQ